MSKFALVKSGMLVCLALITLVSCYNEPEPQPNDAASLETKELREKYANKVKGNWEYVLQSDLGYMKVNYTFADDDIMEGHLLYMTRDSVMVKGERVVTDWDVSIDEDFAGYWDLRYLSAEKKNVLHLHVTSGYAQQEFAEFYDVNDSILEIQSPYPMTKIARMKRIDCNMDMVPQN